MGSATAEANASESSVTASLAEAASTSFVNVSDSGSRMGATTDAQVRRNAVIVAT